MQPAERIIRRGGARLDQRDRRIEPRRQRVAIAHEPGIPARDVVPLEGRGDRDALYDAVRVRGERLDFDFGHFGRGPCVHTPPLRLRGPAWEREIAFLDAEFEARGRVHDVARAPGEPAVGHPPGVMKVPGHDRLQGLDRVAEVDDRAGFDAGQRDPVDLHVRIHRVQGGGGRRGFLLVRRCGADDGPVRPNHTGPVERETLARAYEGV